LTPYLTARGILLSSFSLSTNQTFALLNLYGPCKDILLFYNSLDKSGLLSTKHLIIGGDLNIILSPEEAWGGTPGIGFNGEHYKALFNKNNLFDISPDKLVLTWRNDRTGMEAIARRLDRFLVVGDLISDIGLYRSWVEYPFISDHALIFLQLEVSPIYKHFPFKFNLHWLQEKYFVDLVKKIWNDPSFTTEGNRQLRLIHKLKELKKQAKLWYKDHQSKKTTSLVLLESEISLSLSQLEADPTNLDLTTSLQTLEQDIIIY
jgi:hypothetical protein